MHVDSKHALTAMASLLSPDNPLHYLWMSTLHNAIIFFTNWGGTYEAVVFLDVKTYILVQFTNVSDEYIASIFSIQERLL